jgi:hypothetical protein
MTRTPPAMAAGVADVRGSGVTPYNVHAAMVARCLGCPLRACIERGGELVAKGTGMRKEKKKPKKKK